VALHASPAAAEHQGQQQQQQQQQQPEQKLLPASRSWIAAEQLLRMVGRTQQHSPDSELDCYNGEGACYWQHSNAAGSSAAAGLFEMLEQQAFAELEVSVAAAETAAADELVTMQEAVAAVAGSSEASIAGSSPVEQCHDEQVQQQQEQQQQPSAALQEVLVQLRSLQHLGSPEHSTAQLAAPCELQGEQQQQQQQQALEAALQLQLQHELSHHEVQLPPAAATAAATGPNAAEAAAAGSVTAGLLDLLQQHSRSASGTSREDDEWLQLLASVENVDDPLQLLRALRGLHSSSRGGSDSSRNQPSGSGAGDDSSRMLDVAAADDVATAAAGSSSNSEAGTPSVVQTFPTATAAGAAIITASSADAEPSAMGFGSAADSAAAGVYASVNAVAEQQLVLPNACSSASLTASDAPELPQQQQQQQRQQSDSNMQAEQQQSLQQLQLLQQLLSGEASAASSSALASPAGLLTQLLDASSSEHLLGSSLQRLRSTSQDYDIAEALAVTTPEAAAAAAGPAEVGLALSTGPTPPADMAEEPLAGSDAEDDSSSSSSEASEASEEAAASQLGSLIQQLAELGAASGRSSSSEAGSSSTGEHTEQPTPGAAVTAAVGSLAVAAAAGNPLPNVVPVATSSGAAPAEAADAAAMFIHAHSQHWQLVMQELVAWVQHHQRQQEIVQASTGSSDNKQQVSNGQGGCGRCRLCVR
jgi:hypothetical protein